MFTLQKSSLLYLYIVYITCFYLLHWISQNNHHTSVYLSAYAQAEHQFACISPLEGEETEECSILAANCSGDKKIKTSKVHYGTKNSTGVCSSNATDCKIFEKGCCAYVRTDDIVQVQPKDVLPIRKFCDGKQNCSFRSSEVVIDLSKDFLMFEYGCVDDVLNVTYLDICDETDTAFVPLELLLYTQLYHSDVSMRRRCTCEITPTLNNTSLELQLSDVIILSENNSCPTTRLRIGNDLILACGVFKGLSVTLKESFIVDIDMSDALGSENIEISVKAVDGGMTVNCSSRTINVTERKSDETVTACEKYSASDDEHTNLSVAVAVPVAALATVLTIVIIGLFIKYRSNMKTLAIQSKLGKDVKTVGRPVYYVVDPHEREISRNSGRNSFSSRIQANNETLADQLQTNVIIENDTNLLHPPAVAHYERISLSSTNGVPNVGYTSYNTEQIPDSCKQNDILDETLMDSKKEKPNEYSSDDKGELKIKEADVHAGYDKLTFSKPQCKLSTYNTVKNTSENEHTS